MTATRRLAPFAAALLIALAVFAAHLAARPAAASDAPPSATPAPVAVPPAPALAAAAPTAPAAQPIIVAAVPVPTPPVTNVSSATSRAASNSAATALGQPPSFVLRLSSPAPYLLGGFVFLLAAIGFIAARRPTFPRRPIAA